MDLRIGIGVNSKILMDTTRKEPLSSSRWSSMGKLSLQVLQLFGYHEGRAWRGPKGDANTMNGRTERARKIRPLVTLLCPLGPAMPEVKSYH